MTNNTCPECGHTIDVSFWQMALHEHMKAIHRERAERDEARAWARKFCAERNEVARDLRNSKNEIRQLRMWLLEFTKSKIEKSDMPKYFVPPMINDGIVGQSISSWCSECGGDMQVVGRGEFRCAECGR